jgi:hypothetical protein
MDIDTLKFFLLELANSDSENIESDDFEIYGETEEGLSGTCFCKITDVAAEALKKINELQKGTSTEENESWCEVRMNGALISKYTDYDDAYETWDITRKDNPSDTVQLFKLKRDVSKVSRPLI